MRSHTQPAQLKVPFIARGERRKKGLGKKTKQNVTQGLYNIHTQYSIYALYAHFIQAAKNMQGKARSANLFYSKGGTMNIYYGGIMISNRWRLQII